MPQEPQRVEHRKTHLDASLVPLERALNERAERLDRELQTGPVLQPEFMGGPLQDHADAYRNVLRPVLARLAAEYRDLAEELHHW